MDSARVIKIGRFLIGGGHRCFIIAEAGVNHNGDLRTAKRLIEAAKKAGADAVKFQTFKTKKLVTRDAPKARYQIRNMGSTGSQFDMLQKLELSKRDFKILFNHCLKKKILFLSSPFDEESADSLETLRVPAFKIGSGEITNFPLLRHVAKKGKPIILSTGMSDLREVKDAVQVIRSAGCRHLALLHCVSNYPADPKDTNLRAMETMRSKFHVPIGFSDHTLGITVCLAAAALGACIIEKHFTLNRKTKGPDHAASLVPEEFAAMVREIRTTESSLGDGRKVPARSERNTALVARRSLVAAHKIKTGQVITRSSVDIKRPGTGLKPGMLKRLLGRTARTDIPAGTLLSFRALR